VFKAVQIPWPGVLYTAVLFNVLPLIAIVTNSHMKLHAKNMLITCFTRVIDTVYNIVCCFL
jgi:hypothetical protein